MKKTQIAPSTRTGSHHWLMQKISSVALIPLVIWLLYSIVTVASDVDANLAVFFAYPLNAILAILLIGVSLYHGSIGMTVIFEDYIENAKVPVGKPSFLEISFQVSPPSVLFQRAEPSPPLSKL